MFYFEIEYHKLTTFISKTLKQQFNSLYSEGLLHRNMEKSIKIGEFFHKIKTSTYSKPRRKTKS